MSKEKIVAAHQMTWNASRKTAGLSGQEGVECEMAHQILSKFLKEMPEIQPAQSSNLSKPFKKADPDIPPTNTKTKKKPKFKKKTKRTSKKR